MASRPRGAKSVEAIRGGTVCHGSPDAPLNAETTTQGAPPEGLGQSGTVHTAAILPKSERAGNAICAGHWNR